MLPDRAFSSGGALAVLSWLALSASLFAPVPVRSAIWVVTSMIVPAVIGVAYVVLLARGLRDRTGGGFGSIAAVRRLFSSDAALASGWLHYLAFDLFVGTWIARQGLADHIPQVLILPCFLATFLAGPAGLLLFLVLRFGLGSQVGIGL